MTLCWAVRCQVTCFKLFSLLKGKKSMVIHRSASVTAASSCLSTCSQPTCIHPGIWTPLKRESQIVIASRSHTDDKLSSRGFAISTGKAEAGKWKGMVFIPRAQPLCRPVTLPTTLRGETEGILSFLPSIPVKSFIIQLPDYFKKLTRLWFLSAFVCLCVWEGERVSKREALLAVGCTPGLLPTPHYPHCHPHRLFPHPLYTHFPQLLSTTFFCILQNF